MIIPSVPNLNHLFGLVRLDERVVFHLIFHFPCETPNEILNGKGKPNHHPSTWWFFYNTLPFNAMILDSNSERNLQPFILLPKKNIVVLQTQMFFSSRIGFRFILFYFIVSCWIFKWIVYFFSFCSVPGSTSTRFMYWTQVKAKAVNRLDLVYCIGILWKISWWYKQNERMSASKRTLHSGKSFEGSFQCDGFMMCRLEILFVTF